MLPIQIYIHLIVILSFSSNKGEEIQQCAIFDAGNGFKEIVMGVFSILSAILRTKQVIDL